MQAWSLSNLLAHGPNFSNSPEQQFQMHLNVERIRIPEILFQPSIVGIDQGGLAQTFKHLVNRFPIEKQRSLATVLFPFLSFPFLFLPFSLL